MKIKYTKLINPCQLLLLLFVIKLANIILLEAGIFKYVSIGVNNTGSNNIGTIDIISIAVAESVSII